LRTREPCVLHISASLTLTPGPIEYLFSAMMLTGFFFHGARSLARALRYNHLAQPSYLPPPASTPPRLASHPPPRAPTGSVCFFVFSLVLPSIVFRANSGGFFGLKEAFGSEIPLFSGQLYLTHILRGGFEVAACRYFSGSSVRH